jgi:hypothetical protein
MSDIKVHNSVITHGVGNIEPDVVSVVIPTIPKQKAVVEEDIIIVVGHGNTEIGELPKGVGLERLRWDGSQIIDLANLSEIWVRSVGQSFELHCIEVANSILVSMTYGDRKNLTTNGSVIRLKTEEELYQENVEILTQIAKDRLNQKLGDQHMNALMFIMSLIVYVRQQPQPLADFFDEIIPDIKDIFPMSRVEDLLKQAAKDLKVAMEEYWDEIDAIP